MSEIPKIPDLTGESHARDLDAQDPLRGFRDEFYFLADTVYLDGRFPVLWGFWAKASCS